MGKKTRRDLAHESMRKNPNVQHRELYLMLCGDLNGKGICKRGHIRTSRADSLCCTVEINTMLWSNYTLIKTNLKKKRKQSSKKKKKRERARERKSTRKRKEALGHAKPRGSFRKSGPALERAGGDLDGWGAEWLGGGSSPWSWQLKDLHRHLP